MPRQRPSVRAPKPSQHERATRQAVIDVLLGRALRGVLTIPEAVVLADYVRAERRKAEKTRRSLGDTTRALQRHREAADEEVQRLEARVGELAGADPEAPREPPSAPRSVPQPSDGAQEPRIAPGPSQARTRPAA